MLGKSAPYALFLALLVTGAESRAQDSGEAGTDRDPEATEQAGTGQGTPPQGSQQSTTPETAGGDPFDYESSEQISEDLSVSFPVDI